MDATARAFETAKSAFLSARLGQLASVNFVREMREALAFRSGNWPLGLAEGRSSAHSFHLGAMVICT